MHINPSINTVLFDLDGTLLPMDMDAFVKSYFTELAKKAVNFGYDSKTIEKAVWGATKSMILNDGAAPNIDVFWKAFVEILGEKANLLKEPFDAFYLNEFHQVKSATGENPFARTLIDRLKEEGYTVVVATNPLFPLDGNRTRLSWIGLDEADFAYISAYENSSYCKPNPEYYNEILRKIGKRSEECIMIGNDATEDLAAAKTGMDTYLVTDCLLNTHGLDISSFKQGDFASLMEFFFEG